MRVDADGVRVAGPSAHPFTVKAAKGTAGKHDIVEEVAVKAETALKSLGNDQLQQFADAPAASPGLRAALKETLALRRKVEDGLKALADREREMKQVSEDQARLRSNLAIVPPSSEHYRKFLEKFVARETEIETMQKQIRELQAVQETRQRELETYVSALAAK